jgi:outer membrane protein, multidrug efflux system
MTNRLAAAVLAALTISLVGCDLGPDYHKPALNIPPQFRATPQTEVAAWPAPGWWSGFRSPELDQLEAQAEAQNFDIAAAIARVRQADAQVRISSAPLLPTLDATAGASYAQSSLSSRSSGSLSGTQVINVHTYNLGLNVAYETDFWGHNLASRRAAVASAVFSRWDQQTVALTVVTNVAQTWFTALELADRLVVARQNLQFARQTLAVIQGRLAAGTETELGLAQQEALVKAEEANIPALQSQLEQELIGLGILTGVPPEQVTARPGTLNTLALPRVWPGLPSQLLERRPDVAEAEAQLVAANFNVKVARAAFFPNVELTGERGYEAVALSQLFSPGGIIIQLAGSVVQPIFDAGTLRGNLELNEGRYQELLADYRKAVVQAFTDVDNALTTWRYTTEQEALQAQAVAAAKRAADAAAAQLAAGTVDVTTVLTTETTLLNDEDLLVQIHLSRFLALLSLYRALGGGWVQPSGPILDQFPGLNPGLVPGGVAIPGNRL